MCTDLGSTKRSPSGCGRSTRCRYPFLWSETSRLPAAVFLNTNLLCKFDCGDCSTGSQDQPQSFMIPCGENPNGFGVFKVGRRGANEHGNILRFGDVTDDAACVLVLAADEQREVAISTSLDVLANRHNHAAQDRWCGACGTDVEDTEHRAMSAVRGHEASDKLASVWIVPNDRSGTGWNELDVEVNRIRHV